MCLTIHTFTPCKIGEGRYRPEETTHGSYQLSLIYIKKYISNSFFLHRIMSKLSVLECLQIKSNLQSRRFTSLDAYPLLFLHITVQATRLRKKNNIIS